MNLGISLNYFINKALNQVGYDGRVLLGVFIYYSNQVRVGNTEQFINEPEISIDINYQGGGYPRQIFPNDIKWDYRLFPNTPSWVSSTKQTSSYIPNVFYQGMPVLWRCYPINNFDRNGIRGEIILNKKVIIENYSLTYDELQYIPEAVTIEQYTKYTEEEKFKIANSYGSKDAMKRRDGILEIVGGLLSDATNWTVDKLKDAFKYHNQTYMKEKYATPADLDADATAWATWENSKLKQQYIDGLGALNIAQGEVSRQLFKEQIIANAKKNNYGNTKNANEKSMGEKLLGTTTLYTDKYGNPSTTMVEGGGQIAVSIGADGIVKITNTNGINATGKLTSVPLGVQVMKKDGTFEYYNPMNDALYQKSDNGQYISGETVTEAVPSDFATDPQLAMWEKKWKEDVEKETKHNYWEKYEEEHYDLESENAVNKELATFDLEDFKINPQSVQKVEHSEEVEYKVMCDLFEQLYNVDTN